VNFTSKVFDVIAIVQSEPFFGKAY